MVKTIKHKKGVFDVIDPQAPEREEHDFASLHAKHLINVNKPIERQPVALSVGTHYHGQTSYPMVFGSYGDFSCLVGASKSMKTFLKSALIAGYIGGNTIEHFSGFKGHNTHGKFILDIDTEQSPFHTQRAAKRVLKMVGTEYENYVPFSLREMTPATRLQFVEWLVNESKYSGNIGLVAIDGAADLVENVNDLEKANQVTQRFMKWTSSQHCHLITILHRNFGSVKPTGHLGSSILKKAETVAFVERKDGVTQVTAEYTRNRPFDRFSFVLNNEALPVEVDNSVMI